MITRPNVVTTNGSRTWPNVVTTKGSKTRQNVVTTNGSKTWLNVVTTNSSTTWPNAVTTDGYKTWPNTVTTKGCKTRPNTVTTKAVKQDQTLGQQKAPVYTTNLAHSVPSCLIPQTPENSDTVTTASLPLATSSFIAAVQHALVSGGVPNSSKALISWHLHCKVWHWIFCIWNIVCAQNHQTGMNR